MKKISTLLALFLFSCSFIIHAQKIKLVKFSSGYGYPIGIENCGDSRLFVIEKKGKIYVCDSAGKRATKPYLDITDRVLVGGEQGLLGLAFDPNYLTNGFFYVNYINKESNTQISRFRVKTDSPNVALKSSEKFILQIPQTTSIGIHNGGGMRFGPDGYLYIGMGDGGDGIPANTAQNTMSLLGKMLRIDVRSGLPYKIPPTNPFVDSPNYKAEIWALGFRNPWRWSFDALTGAIRIGDVGQDNWEEINLQQKGVGGKNYGWRCYEGNQPFNTTGCKPKSAYSFPIYAYKHTDTTGGDCSVIGGFVYRGSKYPALYGKYIFTDYCSGVIRLLYKDGSENVVKIGLNGANSTYTSFGEAANLELYLCNATEGSIYHVIERPTSLQSTYAENEDAEQNDLSISPNPSHGSINISYTSARAAQITLRITSIVGKQFYSTSRVVSQGTNTWNINTRIPKGSYYLSVINNTAGIITQSLRIE